MREFFMGGGVPSENAKLFGINHLLWVAAAVVFIVAAAIYVSKKPSKTQVLLLVMAVVMLVLRAVKYLIMKPFVWQEGWISVVPFQLCTIISYVMPFTVFFKTEKLNKFIYPLAIFGGVITVLYADWVFNGSGLNFNKVESMIVHILLVAIPVVSTFGGRFKYKIAEFYKPIVAMSVLVLYAYIANTYITPGANHMYIVRNPLPLDFGVHHFVAFALGFIVVMFLMYLPSLIRYLRRRKGRSA